jgi:diaminopimelate epimerase
MNIPFVKYSGTGNDFILIDDRLRVFPSDDLELISKMCDRHFGIGSDGLMLIRNHPDADFEMIFFNPDGSKSMCGNGSRCAVHFALSIGAAVEAGSFVTTDGLHEYQIIDKGLIRISMSDVGKVDQQAGHAFLNTGSPHLLVDTDRLDQVDVISDGRSLRNHPDFYALNGCNVNFTKKLDDRSLRIRTYERGVEGETLSCGTGVTAAALAHVKEDYGDFSVQVFAEGGELEVSFTKDESGFKNIFLTGPVSFIFKGEYNA